MINLTQIKNLNESLGKYYEDYRELFNWLDKLLHTHDFNKTELLQINSPELEKEINQGISMLHCCFTENIHKSKKLINLKEEAELKKTKEVNQILLDLKKIFGDHSNFFEEANISHKKLEKIKFKQKDSFSNMLLRNKKTFWNGYSNNKTNTLERVLNKHFFNLQNNGFFGHFKDTNSLITTGINDIGLTLNIPNKKVRRSLLNKTLESIFKLGFENYKMNRKNTNNILFFFYIIEKSLRENDDKESREYFNSMKEKILNKYTKESDYLINNPINVTNLIKTIFNTSSQHSANQYHPLEESNLRYNFARLMNLDQEMVEDKEFSIKLLTGEESITERIEKFNDSFNKFIQTNQKFASSLK
ncbi:MAG: hypothetical protein HRT47_06145 [Candidatus Caenarcaniphilales bacterium]|nr:hypothetical protein [Candidatus Caenarcaniphilales bacterium]